MGVSLRSHQGKPCSYCQRLMLHLTHRTLAPTRDHVVPKSRGGRAVVVCCITCNGIKGNMLPEEWESFMAAYPEWWKLTKLELRAIWRAPRKAARDEKWGPRRRLRQGTPPAAPVVVPPEYIWPSCAAGLRTITPELIASTIEQDAKLRSVPSDGR